MLYIKEAFFLPAFSVGFSPGFDLVRLLNAAFSLLHQERTFKTSALQHLPNSGFSNGRLVLDPRYIVDKNDLRSGVKTGEDLGRFDVYDLRLGRGDMSKKGRGIPVDDGVFVAALGLPVTVEGPADFTPTPWLFQ